METAVTVWDPKDVHDRAEQVSTSAVPRRETEWRRGPEMGPERWGWTRSTLGSARYTSTSWVCLVRVVRNARFLVWLL